MTRVKVVLTGGLGNQMFGAAAGVALAERLGCPLELDLSEFTNLNSRMYQLDFFDYFKNFKINKQQSISPFHRYSRFNFRHRIFQEDSFEFDDKFSKISKGCTLKGYFQSWRYFEGFEQTIDAAFSSPLENPITQEIEQSLGENYIGVHLRRGDYLIPHYADYHGMISEEYMAKVLSSSRMLDFIDLPKVLFTDSPEYLSNDFKMIFDFIVNPQSDVHPFQHMQALSSSKILILSNSSFSWWAGYFASKNSSQVIAPPKWFKSKGFSRFDLYPASWQIAEEF